MKVANIPKSTKPVIVIMSTSIVSDSQISGANMKRPESRLDAVADIQLQSCGAGAHPFNFAKRSTINAGLLTLVTLKIHGIVRGYFGCAKDIIIARQTSEIPFAIHGLFQCFFADFVFFFRHIVTREAGEPLEVRTLLSYL
jgi:hypothetical protein